MKISHVLIGLVVIWLGLIGCVTDRKLGNDYYCTQDMEG